ncbi:MAG: GAF domain-containing protein [Thomasclavelia ramosa]
MKEQQLDALLENINYEISLLSNASAFIKQVFLIYLGLVFTFAKIISDLRSIQGKTACTLIPFTKGVCGACATNLKTYCVPDVHQFPSHIACDSATNSELVIPLIIDNSLYGVLDLDSRCFARFQPDDQEELEKLALIIIKHLKRIKEETK